MKISKVQVILLQKKLTSAMNISRGGFDVRTHAVVKVTTDQGITGLGEGVGDALMIKSIIDGKFFKGDNILIVDLDGNDCARGITSFSSDEINNTEYDKDLNIILFNTLSRFYSTINTNLLSHSDLLQ